MHSWYQSHQLPFPASCIPQVPITQRHKYCPSTCRAPTWSQGLSSLLDQNLRNKTVGHTLAGVGWEEKEPEVLLYLSKIWLRSEGIEESLHSSNPAAAPRNHTLNLPRGGPASGSMSHCLPPHCPPPSPHTGNHFSPYATNTCAVNTSVKG